MEVLYALPKEELVQIGSGQEILKAHRKAHHFHPDPVDEGWWGYDTQQWFKDMVEKVKSDEEQDYRTLKDYNDEFEGNRSIANRSIWHFHLEVNLIAELKNISKTYPHRDVLTINVSLPHPDGKMYELMMFTTYKDDDFRAYFEIIDNNPGELDNTMFGKADVVVHIRETAYTVAALFENFLVGHIVGLKRFLLGRAYSPGDVVWFPRYTKLSGEPVDINNTRTTFERMPLSDLLGTEKGIEMRRYVLQLLRKYTDTNFGEVPQSLVEVDAILVHQPPELWATLS